MILTTWIWFICGCLQVITDDGFNVTNIENEYIFKSFHSQMPDKEHIKFSAKRSVINYNNPYWDLPDFCSIGKQQSPIELEADENSGRYYHNLPYEGINFKGYDGCHEGLTLLNNGHSLQLTGFKHMMTVSGGPLTDKYVVEYVEFHWLSEHTARGTHFDAELHIVHRNVKYTNYKTALQNKRGLLIIAALYNATDEPKTGFETIAKVLGKVKHFNRHVQLEDKFQLEDVLSTELNYFMYYGSLTRAPCTEGVIWIVLANGLTMSKQEVELLKNVTYAWKTNSIKPCRDVQNKNGRPVYFYSKNVINVERRADTVADLKNFCLCPTVILFIVYILITI